VILVYSVVAAIAGALVGGGLDVRETAMSIGWELFGSMAFGVLIGVVIGAFLRYVDQGAAMFALLVCVVVAEIGGHVDLDPLIVMLAAGVWLENFSRAKASKLLRGFEAAELPVFLVFFALGGVSLDLGAMWSTLVPVLLLVLARGAMFYFGCRTACARTYADPAIAKYGWTGLVPQAGLSFVLVAVIRQTFPTFGDSAAMLLLSVVGINLLVAPVMLRLALVKTNEAG
jgi:Kef-type K+ transport system membrane component KefB